MTGPNLGVQWTRKRGDGKRKRVFQGRLRMKVYLQMGLTPKTDEIWDRERERNCTGLQFTGAEAFVAFVACVASVASSTPEL